LFSATERCTGFPRLGKWPEPTLASTPRYCLEGLLAEPLPGLPSPRLTFTGRFRAGKAPGVLAMARALLAAPPTYLAGDCPTRQAVIRLVAACGLDRLPGWSHEPAR
jgi:hypothetical protein